MDIELSIIVPVYNVEQYLEECLVSIYAVKNIKKEIILINDGSTDNSLEILKRYKEQYPDITILINKKNGGLSSARNTGIKVAKGEYVSFIDSDDWIDSKKYEEFFKEGQKYDLDIMISGIIFYENNKIIEYDWFKKINKTKIYTGKEYLKEYYKDNLHKVEVCDDIYKRDILVRNNLDFKEGLLHEDELFTPFILFRSNKIKIIDKNFYYYRKREGSIMKKKALKNELCCMYISFILLKNLEFDDENFVKYNFLRYYSKIVETKYLYLSEHIKLMFSKKLKFKDKLRLLKVIIHARKLRWNMEELFKKH